MNTLTKGIAVAVLHLLIVLSLGGKLLYDRAHRPRVWVRTGSVDPDLPIRGRYVTLRLQVQAPWAASGNDYSWSSVTLAAEDGTLVAHKSEADTGVSVSSWPTQPRRPETPKPPVVVYLDQNVAFFLPEHADFPRPKPGEEIWAEVTVPKKGPPRPIQLALKRGTEWIPLSYR
jgi:hypothetical protein